MASTGGGGGRGAARGGATANTPFPQGAFNGRRSTQRGVRRLGSAAISAEEFQRATGVNPRTGRRSRGRG